MAADGVNAARTIQTSQRASECLYWRFVVYFVGEGSIKGLGPVRFPSRGGGIAGLFPLNPPLVQKTYEALGIPRSPRYFAAHISAEKWRIQVERGEWRKQDPISQRTYRFS